MTLSRETLKKTHLLECLEQLRTGQTGHVKIPSFSQKKCSFCKLFFSRNEKAIVQIQSGLGLISILFYLESKQVFYRQCSKTISVSKDFTLIMSLSVLNI